MVSMNRDEALKLVSVRLKRKNLFKHVFAVEAIMRALAKHLGEDVEKWGLLGLLHDIDFEETESTSEKHGIASANELKGKVDDEIVRAIKAHNFEHTEVEPQTKMENALIAADAVSGLIVAAALIIPSKKLSDVKAESIGKRFKEKDFARSCNRERILYCEKLGLTKEKFFEIALAALQGISDELGL